MAKLVEVYRSENEYPIGERQLPLTLINDNIVMVMDLQGMDLVCTHPVVRGRELEDFLQKYSTLTVAEIIQAFEVPRKDLLAILSQTVPCVGCRRSVERLFYQLAGSGHDALAPLVITSQGVVSMREEQLQIPQELCTIMHGHSVRLSNLVESQPRSKKSLRCNLHSLDTQRSRPSPGVWRDVWKCMEQECKDEVLLIESTDLLLTLETYLRKHRFCAECHTKVMKAYSLLVDDPEPAKEKGYIPALYGGIKRCLEEKHLHLPRKTEYIADLISRAEPELMGSRRERHAKTIEIAQEEVLTCLGLCVHDRLHKIQLRLKEEECTCKVLAAVAVEALCRSFETAVEDKLGVSRLELLYEEIALEELAKQQKKEHKKLKRRKKKEKKAGYEDGCKCDNEDNDVENSPCKCIEPDLLSRKTPSDCDCEECLSKGHQLEIGPEDVTSDCAVFKTPSNSIREGKTDKKASRTCANDSAQETNNGNILVEQQLSPCQSCKSAQTVDTKALTKNRLLNSEWSSSEHSQDYGYSSENNNGCCDSVTGSSLGSSPEGSEVACSEGLCNHDLTLTGQSSDGADQRGTSEHNCPNSTRANGLALSLLEMLADTCSSDDDGGSYLSPDEVLEFNSNISQVAEKRHELRLKLKEQFNKMCIKNKMQISHVSHCASN